MTYETFADALELDHQQRQTLFDLVNAHKDALIERLDRPAARGHTSPIELLAQKILENPQLAEADRASIVDRAIQSQRPAEGAENYAELMMKGFENFAVEIVGHLTPDQQARFFAMGPPFPMQLDTGHDPLAAPLAARAAEVHANNAAKRGGLISELPDRVDKAARVAGRFCENPFEFAQVTPDGQVFGCCPAMLFLSYGNLERQSFMEAWNSTAAQRVRATILDGSFKYCNSNTCDRIQTNTLPRIVELSDPEHQRIVSERITKLEHGPKTINFAYDRTCNLTCGSCRDGKIVLKGEPFNFARRIHEQVLALDFTTINRLIITGSGDPFVSKLYLKFLRTFDPKSAPHLRIQLSTNGTLLDEEMWDSICNDAIDFIDISIDAATPETYKLNRGGDFARLVRNLEFIGDLRTYGEIETFQIHFVVQANNFREMPAFAELGIRCNCDRIVFKQLQNWGTYGPGEYEQRAVQLPEHPDHAAFRRVRTHPILRHPSVALHDL